MNIQVESLTGKEIERFADELAALRIEVFREWPYLYEGTEESEREYLEAFWASERGLMVVARDGDTVVGASTALPLADETENIIKPWAAGGFDIGSIFYFGESVLRREYRGRGIGVEFFRQREARARHFGEYTRMTFCAVVRDERDPRRPVDYVPLDRFWQNRGYAKIPGMHCIMDWKEPGIEGESSKELVFWQKAVA